MDVAFESSSDRQRTVSPVGVVWHCRDGRSSDTACTAKIPNSSTTAGTLLCTQHCVDGRPKDRDTKVHSRLLLTNPLTGLARLS